MKRSVIVMSPIEGGMECEPKGGLEFELEGAPPVAAADCWGVQDTGLEGIGITVGCAVEPEGAGVSPTLGSILQDTAEAQREGGLGGISL